MQGLLVDSLLLYGDGFYQSDDCWPAPRDSLTLRVPAVFLLNGKILMRRWGIDSLSIFNSSRTGQMFPSTAGKVRVRLPQRHCNRYTCTEAKCKRISDFKKSLEKPGYHMLITTSGVLVGVCLRPSYWTSSNVLLLARQSLKMISPGNSPLSSQLNSSAGCSECSWFSSPSPALLLPVLRWRFQDQLP